VVQLFTWICALEIRSRYEIVGNGRAASNLGFTVAFKNATTNFTAASTYKFAYNSVGK